MEITSIKYANDEGTGLIVNNEMYVPWPCATWHNEFIQEWITEGNTISAHMTLEESKAHKKQLINIERDARKFLTITYDSDEFDVTDWDMTMISTLLNDVRAGKPLPAGQFWRTKNNNQRALTETDLDNLNDAIKTQIQTAYAWSWAKKSEIDAAVDDTALDAIDLELVNTGV